MLTNFVLRLGLFLFGLHLDPDTRSTVEENDEVTEVSKEDM